MAVLFTGPGVAHEPGAPALQVLGVTVSYGSVLALEDASLEIATGEQVAVVGPNGSGKSTLLSVIAGTLEPTRGEVRVFGYLPGGHTCIAYVPQRSQVDWSFPVTVADVVMMGRVVQMGWLEWPRKRDWDHVRHCLRSVGMLDYATRQIGELSGGQRQRVFIARALAQEAQLVLMDEPLAGLDLPAQEGVVDVISGLRDRGVTVMVTTHNLSLATSHFDKVALLNRRVIGFGTPDEVFTPDRLAQAYGDHLHLAEASGNLGLLDDTCSHGRGYE